jgi:hypothetical protein
VVAEQLLPLIQTISFCRGSDELLGLGGQVDLVTLILMHILTPALRLNPLADIGLGDFTHTGENLDTDLTPVFYIIGKAVIMVLLQFLRGVILDSFIVLDPLLGRFDGHHPP